jgi:hypothetical protein
MILLIYDLYIKINGNTNDGNGNDVEIDPGMLFRRLFASKSTDFPREYGCTSRAEMKRCTSRAGGFRECKSHTPLVVFHKNGERRCVMHFPHDNQKKAQLAHKLYNNLYSGVIDTNCKTLAP